MTTGRINQVTILTGGRPRPRRGAPSDGTPGASPGQSSSLGRGDPRVARPPTHDRRARRLQAGVAGRAIHLPPLSSPRCGPPQDRSGHGPPRTATYAPQEEDTAGRSHPKAATGQGLPPSVFCKNDSHRPTIHRPQRRRRGQCPHRTSDVRYWHATAPDPRQVGSPALTVRTVDNTGPMESFADGAAPACQDTDCCPAGRIPRRNASGPSQLRDPTASHSSAHRVNHGGACVAWVHQGLCAQT
jgi:hypothetical protein